MATVSRIVKITNKLGLHARAATKLAQLSQKFDADVTLTLEDNKADASSIMGLMLLAGGFGKEVEITADGEDATQALDDICQLFSNNFNEEQ